MPLLFFFPNPGCLHNRGNWPPASTSGECLFSPAQRGALGRPCPVCSCLPPPGSLALSLGLQHRGPSLASLLVWWLIILGGSLALTGVRNCQCLSLGGDLSPMVLQKVNSQPLLREWAKLPHMLVANSCLLPGRGPSGSSVSQVSTCLPCLFSPGSPLHRLRAGGLSNPDALC